MSAPKIVARTELSPVRSDSYEAIRIDVERGIAVLAVGVGSHVAPAEAAALAADLTLQRLLEFERATEAQLREVAALATAALGERERTVPKRKKRQAAMGGMLATLDAVVLTGDEALILHIGNNRTYCLEQDRARRLTTDHTLAQDLAGGGVDVPRDASDRHVITAVVGAPPGDSIFGRVEIVKTAVCTDTVLLLCSDGVYDGVESDDELARFLCADGDLAHNLDALVAALIARKVQENVTAIAIAAT